MSSTRSKLLQCRWEKIEPLDDQSIKLFFPAKNCCDMEGAIKMAKMIMPKVRRVLTYQEGVVDVEYMKIGRTEWETIDHWRFRDVKNKKTHEEPTPGQG